MGDTMRKSFLILIGLVVVALAVAGCSSPPEDVAKADVQAQDTTTPPMPPAQSGDWEPIDTTASTFEFEGYAPGKSHVGTFNFYEGELLVEEGVVVGARGTINASSVQTGIDGLNKHLKSDDFFDVENHPEITFSSTSITDGVLTGDLTFIGITNKVSFPVTIDGTTLSAEFLLDTTPYDMKYVAVNKEVRIAFAMTT